MASRRDAILRSAAKEIARKGVRGLKVEEVARQAGVSLGLVYYHFTDRAGLLGATLLFVNGRASAYVSEAVADALDAREAVARRLLSELQDDPLVMENSIAWAELRSSAVFEVSLREPLRRTTDAWTAVVALGIGRAQAARLVSPQVDADEAAARLTALVEGLSDRWLSGSLALDDARRMLADAVDREFGPAPGAVVGPRRDGAHA